MKTLLELVVESIQAQSKREPDAEQRAITVSEFSERCNVTHLELLAILEVLLAGPSDN
jgi:hypothetical protein